MSLDFLKKNIERQKVLLNRVEVLTQAKTRIGNSGGNRKALDDSINASLAQIKLINDSIPYLVDEIKLTKKLPSENKLSTRNFNQSKPVEYAKGNVISLTSQIGTDEEVAIMKKDKENFLKQLHIAESSLKKLRKSHGKEKEDEFTQEFKQASKYVKISNKLFAKLANDLLAKNYFTDLKNSLRKGNFMILTNSYTAMMFFTSFLSIFVGILLAIFFFFFSLSIETPFIYLVDFSQVSVLMRILQVIWLIPATPILTFLVMYYYPQAEKSSIASNLEYELPFATIQMSAIAGADIEPSNIFRIIALSKEYPTIRKEAKKLMNQINLYGYDLITALNNIAQASPSRDWTDLLNGISTTMRSGGDLGKYLEKKAETLLFDYRLKREKSTKSAETFMDIYISVVIAAPMLMMLLLIMISISGIGIGLSVGALTTIVVSIVAMINLVFLVFLHLGHKSI